MMRVVAPVHYMGSKKHVRTVVTTRDATGRPSALVLPLAACFTRRCWAS